MNTIVVYNSADDITWVKKYKCMKAYHKNTTLKLKKSAAGF